jgi:hypothetical protein
MHGVGLKIVKFLGKIYRILKHGTKDGGFKIKRN